LLTAVAAVVPAASAGPRSAVLAIPLNGRLNNSFFSLSHSGVFLFFFTELAQVVFKQGMYLYFAHFAFPYFLHGVLSVVFFFFSFFPERHGEIGTGRCFFA